MGGFWEFSMWRTNFRPSSHLLDRSKKYSYLTYVYANKFSLSNDTRAAPLIAQHFLRLKIVYKNCFVYANHFVVLARGDIGFALITGHCSCVFPGSWLSHLWHICSPIQLRSQIGLVRFHHVPGTGKQSNPTSGWHTAVIFSGSGVTQKRFNSPLLISLLFTAYYLDVGWKKKAQIDIQM